MHMSKVKEKTDILISLKPIYRQIQFPQIMHTHPATAVEHYAHSAESTIM